MQVIKGGEKVEKQFQVERDILFFATRYALGRMTFAPSTILENIQHNIDQFNANDLKLLIRDIEEQKSYGYGMKCDEDLWLGLKVYLQNELNELINR